MDNGQMAIGNRQRAMSNGQWANGKKEKKKLYNLFYSIKSTNQKIKNCSMPLNLWHSAT